MSSFLGRIAALASILGAAGCASPSPPPSSALLARCNDSYGHWLRYQGYTLNHTGQRARAELASGDCQGGRYHPDIEVLEDLLRQGRYPI